MCVARRTSRPERGAAFELAALRTLEAWRPSLPGNATGERFGPGPPDAILLTLCPSAPEAVGPGVDPDGVCEEGPENPVPEEGGDARLSQSSFPLLVFIALVRA
jgi:hypothetical protein